MIYRLSLIIHAWWYCEFKSILTSFSLRVSLVLVKIMWKTYMHNQSENWDVRPKLSYCSNWLIWIKKKSDFKANQVCYHVTYFIAIYKYHVTAVLAYLSWLTKSGTASIEIEALVWFF